MTESALFGINKSNRDFTSANNWEKNQFNSSFPAALACFMYDRDIEPRLLNVRRGFNSLSL